MGHGLKAFAVTEDYESIGGIFFEKHAIVARRRAADEYAEGDFSAVTCRRAPWADAYVGRDVPARLMVRHGWRFECSQCYETIDEYHPQDGNVIGGDDGPTFCGSRCARRWYSFERRRKAEESRAIRTFQDIVLKRLPGVVFLEAGYRYFDTNACVEPSRSGWQWVNVAVAFTFPGMKFRPALFQIDPDRMKNHGPKAALYTCHPEDRDAFKAFADSCKEIAA